MIVSTPCLPEKLDVCLLLQLGCLGKGGGGKAVKATGVEREGETGRGGEGS